MKKELHLLNDEEYSYNNNNFNMVINILLKYESFEFTSKKYFVRIFYCSLFVQAPINSKTIRIATRVINIGSFLSVKFQSLIP